MAKNELAPGFLLAAPSLRDPNFEKTVVLLGRHDHEGALGWVVNGRELAPVKELLGASGLFPAETPIPDTAPFLAAARLGGPVAPATGWLIYRRQREALPGELKLGKEIGVTGEVSAFSKLLGGEGPDDFRLVLGCAGWAPGQLEREISVGAWLPTPVEGTLVFTLEGDEVWDEAYRRQVGAEPAAFSSRRGKA
jgi:putative transcriptional regulator